jgi:thiol-disulfide isomerase/thioredoxin
VLTLGKNALAAAALLVGLALTGGAGPRAATPRTAEEEIAAGQSAAGKYKPSPIISPLELEQKMAKQKGRAFVLQFWATWCTPCLAELPVMQKFAHDMKSKGLDVLPISLDDPVEAAAWRVGRVLHERTGGQVKSAILKVSDTQAFLHSIDARWDGVIPAMFIFDRNGLLRRAHVGEADRTTLDRLVADVIARPGKK